MSVSEDTYGVQGSKQHTPIEVEEHAIIGGVAAKKVFPIDLPPTAQTNASLTISYNAEGEVVKIEKTIGSTVYTKTLTRTDNVVASTLPISSWS
jgi:hypothetical protein